MALSLVSLVDNFCDFFCPLVGFTGAFFPFADRLARGRDSSSSSSSSPDSISSADTGFLVDFVVLLDFVTTGAIYVEFLVSIFVFFSFEECQNGAMVALSGTNGNELLPFVVTGSALLRVDLRVVTLDSRLEAMFYEGKKEWRKRERR